MADKLIIKGSTGKRKSNWYAPMSDERREEVKKRQREAYYRKKIANKTRLLQTEQKKDVHISHAKDERNPKRNQYAMFSEEKKEEMHKRSRNVYYAKRKMTMQVETSIVALDKGDANGNAISAPLFNSDDLPHPQRDNIYFKNCSVKGVHLLYWVTMLYSLHSFMYAEISL